MSQRFWAILLLAGLLAGCISVQSHRRANAYDIHHHTWWNHYQRGRLYLKDQKYTEAKRDFETALGRIPGARYPFAQERWRARTYGMHMIEGYFPHRELGICLFELGQTDNAFELLETSMQMEPSARAKFYINRIRAQQAVASAPPPEIELSPCPEWTAQREVLIEGAARGANAVASITLNDAPEFFETAAPRIEFSRTLTLHEGRNAIRIAATDLSGKQTVTNLTVTADWTPPQITIQRTAAGPILSCRDNLNLARLDINGRSVAVASCRVEIPLTPGRPLQVSAADRSGNRIEWSVSKAEIEHLSAHPAPRPPTLHIPNIGKTVTLYSPEYALDIRADDDTALESVTLNGTELLPRSSPLFRTLQRVPLKTGTNRLVVAAGDGSGNWVEQTVTVMYRPPEYLDRIYRLAASLEPLAGEIPDASFKQHATQHIQQELTLDPVRFYLLAAGADESALEKERSVSGTKLADPRAALKQSRRLNAELAIIPRVLSDGDGQTVYARVLDTASGDELFIEDVYLEEPGTLPAQLAGLVLKIEQRFPLIRAKLLERNGTLLMNAGNTRGAQKGMRFLVIRTEGAFEQGHVVHADGRPVEVTASGVESDCARVIIPRGQSKHSARPGDFVFSR